MALCFPWKKEVEWEQGSVDMIPAPERFLYTSVPCSTTL